MYILIVSYVSFILYYNLLFFATFFLDWKLLASVIFYLIVLIINNYM